MSVFFDITHSTHYRYAQPVALGLHRVLFRPRDSHDLRVLATDLQVYPPPQDVRLVQDAYSNSVALIQPQSPATEFRVDCHFSVEHTGTRALDFALDARAQSFPFSYDAEERLVLAPYLQPYYDDPDGRLRRWATQFIAIQQPTGTRELLVDMTQCIRNTFAYLARTDEGVQTPYETLYLQRGTCRDFATLMVEAIRQLGFAARFVSGYLYTPALDLGPGMLSYPGSTHAWVQVYLPSAGWIEFDPTNGIVGTRDLVRVAVARDPRQAIPLHGTYLGPADAFVGMDVSINVVSVSEEARA